MRTKASLVILAVLVLVSTALNVLVMYERIDPVRREVERASPTALQPAREHLRVVVHDELSRALAMELSTVALGVFAFVRIRRSNQPERDSVA